MKKKKKCSNGNTPLFVARPALYKLGESIWSSQVWKKGIYNNIYHVGGGKEAANLYYVLWPLVKVATSEIQLSLSF